MSEPTFVVRYVSKNARWIMDTNEYNSVFFPIGSLISRYPEKEAIFSSFKDAKKIIKIRKKILKDRGLNLTEKWKIVVRAPSRKITDETLQEQDS